MSFLLFHALTQWRRDPLCLHGRVSQHPAVVSAIRTVPGLFTLNRRLDRCLLGFAGGEKHGQHLIIVIDAEAQGGRAGCVWSESYQK